LFRTYVGIDSRIIRNNGSHFSTLEAHVDELRAGITLDDAGVYLCNGLKEDSDSAQQQRRIEIIVLG